MPPRRRTHPAPPDIDALRLALDQGKIARVGVVPSGQFPDGVTGRVRRIGNPAVDGEEFLFVEVPVGGVKDVLPFAPADLTGSPARSSTPRVPPDEAPDTAAAEPASTRPRSAAARSTGSQRPAPRGKRAPVTITVSTAGDESSVWHIEAKIGTRVAVRPTVIPPSRVWEIVESLGDPKLTDLVQSLLSEHRRVAQARADSLTAELSALQEQLRTYPGGSR